MATADEIVSEAEKLGAKFNKRTLYNYTADKCVPEPKRGAGYGGKWTEYNKMDVVWAVIAWRMIHGVYPKRNDTNGIIDSIKPPRTPPKTVGILHEEFIKKYKEYTQEHYEKGSRFMPTEYILDHCWDYEYEKSGMVVLVLRGMMAWYIYLFAEIKYGIAELTATRKTDNADDECNDEFYKTIRNVMKEIREYIEDLSIK